MACHMLRMVVLLVAVVCLTLIVANIVTLNFAIICMTSRPVPLNVSHYVEDNIMPGPKFTWSKQIRALLFSQFSWGAILATPVYAYLLGHFGTYKSFLVFGILSILTTILTPMVASNDYWWIMICRVISGFCFAAIFPTVGAVTSTWSPITENGIFVGLLSGCIQLGATLAMPLSGSLCTSGYGWPSIYYTLGSLTTIFFGLWAALYRDNVGDSCISKKELDKIRYGKADRRKEKRSVPWRAILTSKSTWAVLLAFLANMVAAQFVTMYSAIYIKNILKFNIKSSGVLSGLPPMIMFVVKLSSGFVSDRIFTARPTLSVRLFNSVAFFGLGACFMAIGFFRDANQAYATLLTGMAFLGFHAGGIFKSVTLTSQEFSPILMSFVQLITCVDILVIPLVVEPLTVKNTQAEWRNIFIIIACLLIVTNILFCVWGSGEPEPWTGLGAIRLREKFNPNDDETATVDDRGANKEEGRIFEKNNGRDSDENQNNPSSTALI